MRKVIASEFVTLDGLIAGPNGETDWFMSDEDQKREFRDQQNATDTILLGRVTYQLFAGFWPSATMADDYGADYMNLSRKIVFSRTLKEAPWGKWESATVVSDRFAEAVQALKQEPGKDIIIYGSARLVQTLSDMGLIDEYRLLVHPLVFGSGKPLFAGGSQPLKLTLRQAKRFSSGVMALYYEPVR